MRVIETEHTGKLFKGDYSSLWIRSPDDWHVRTVTKKTTAHWQRIQHWMQKSVVLGMTLILFRPPGFLWKLPNTKDTLEECNTTTVRIRLFHFGIKFDSEEPTPSGSYLQLATTAKISTKLWQCKHNVPIQEHTLDWYGKDEACAV